MHHGGAFSLHVFFPSGRPGGLRIVKKDNWSGRAIALQREGLDEAIARSDLERTGVYVLRGEEGAETRVYVGETNTLISRLKQHAEEKDFWTEAVLFVREGDELDKADVLYLEARLLQLGKDADRADFDNKEWPKPSSILGTDKEDKIAAVESYLEETLLALRALGFNEFEQLAERSTAAGTADADGHGVVADGGLVVEEAGAQRVLSLQRSGLKMRACGMIDATGGFTVKAGSTGLLSQVKSFEGKPFRKARQRRSELIGSEEVSKEGGLFKLLVDVAFDNPSEAEGVMAGRPGSGLALWRTEDEGDEQGGDRELADDVPANVD